MLRTSNKLETTISNTDKDRLPPYHGVIRVYKGKLPNLCMSFRDIVTISGPNSWSNNSVGGGWSKERNNDSTCNTNIDAGNNGTNVNNRMNGFNFRLDDKLNRSKTQVRITAPFN